MPYNFLNELTVAPGSPTVPAIAFAPGTGLYGPGILDENFVVVTIGGAIRAAFYGDRNGFTEKSIFQHDKNAIIINAQPSQTDGNLGEVAFRQTGSLRVNDEVSRLAFLTGPSGIKLLQNSSGALAWVDPPVPGITSISVREGTGPTQYSTTKLSFTEGANTAIDVTQGPGGATDWVDVKVTATAAGSGTVTSVGASTSLSGLGFSGGPITSSGTLTLSGTLGIPAGGTGQVAAAEAIRALFSNMVTTTGSDVTTPRTIEFFTSGEEGSLSIGGGLAVSGSTGLKSLTTDGNVRFLNLTATEAVTTYRFLGINTANQGVRALTAETVKSLLAIQISDVDSLQTSLDDKVDGSGSVGGLAYFSGAKTLASASASWAGNAFTFTAQVNLSNANLSLYGGGSLYLDAIKIPPVTLAVGTYALSSTGTGAGRLSWSSLSIPAAVAVGATSGVTAFTLTPAGFNTGNVTITLAATGGSTGQALIRAASGGATWQTLGIPAAVTIGGASNVTAFTLTPGGQNTGNVTLTLDATGGSTGQVLTRTASGGASWQAPTGGIGEPPDDGAPYMRVVSSGVGAWKKLVGDNVWT